MSVPDRVSGVRRILTSTRWADVVIHRGVARWVEVAEDRTADFRGQARQVLQQIDATLQSLSADRRGLLQVLVFLADLRQVSEFNEIWDAWVPADAPPVRACVQAGLGAGCLIELVVESALD